MSINTWSCMDKCPGGSVFSSSPLTSNWFKYVQLSLIIQNSALRCSIIVTWKKLPIEWITPPGCSLKYTLSLWRSGWKFNKLGWKVKKSLTTTYSFIKIEMLDLQRHRLYRNVEHGGWDQKLFIETLPCELLTYERVNLHKEALLMPRYCCYSALF